MTGPYTLKLIKLVEGASVHQHPDLRWVQVITQDGRYLFLNLFHTLNLPQEHPHQRDWEYLSYIARHQADRRREEIRGRKARQTRRREYSVDRIDDALPPTPVQRPEYYDLEGQYRYQHMARSRSLCRPPTRARPRSRTQSSRKYTQPTIGAQTNLCGCMLTTKCSFAQEVSHAIKSLALTKQKQKSLTLCITIRLKDQPYIRIRFIRTLSTACLAESLHHHLKMTRDSELRTLPIYLPGYTGSRKGRQQVVHTSYTFAQSHVTSGNNMDNSPLPTHYQFEGGLTGRAVKLSIYTPVYKGPGACQYLVHLPNNTIDVWDFHDIGHPQSLASKAQEVNQLEHLVSLTKARNAIRDQEAHMACKCTKLHTKVKSSQQGLIQDPLFSLITFGDGYERLNSNFVFCPVFIFILMTVMVTKLQVSKRTIESLLSATLMIVLIWVIFDAPSLTVCMCESLNSQGESDPKITCITVQSSSYLSRNAFGLPIRDFSTRSYCLQVYHLITLREIITCKVYLSYEGMLNIRQYEFARLSMTCKGTRVFKCPSLLSRT